MSDGMADFLDQEEGFKDQILQKLCDFDPHNLKHWIGNATPSTRVLIEKMGLSDKRLKYQVIRIVNGELSWFTRNWLMDDGPPPIQTPKPGAG